MTEMISINDMFDDLNPTGKWRRSGIETKFEGRSVKILWRHPFPLYYIAHDTERQRMLLMGPLYSTATPPGEAPHRINGCRTPRVLSYSEDTSESDIMALADTFIQLER